MTTTLTATPAPAPFDIHAQPTWIALTIGAIRRECPGLVVTSVIRPTDGSDHAYLYWNHDGLAWKAAIRKRDMGTAVVAYANPRGAA